MNTDRKQTSEEPRHPIQVVVRRTGVSADVIRAWERRYEALRPKRTSTNRRLYTDTDVERLKLLKRATLGGRRIGSVAGLSLEELSSLVMSDEAAAAEAPVQASVKPRTGSAGPHVDACLEAIHQMDSSALEAALDRAMVSVSVPVLLEQVLSPLLQQIGTEWRLGTMRIGQEHLASSVIRNCLASLRSQGRSNGSDPGRPSLISTTPSGQLHELGALMVAVAAESEGWEVYYLGPNSPAGEVAALVEARGSKAVALSLVYPPDDPTLGEELRTLKRLLPSSVRLLVGGPASRGYREILDEIGAIQAGGLDDLRIILERIRMDQ